MPVDRPGSRPVLSAYAGSAPSPAARVDVGVLPSASVPISTTLRQLSALGQELRFGPDHRYQRVVRAQSLRLDKRDRRVSAHL